MAEADATLTPALPEPQARRTMRLSIIEGGFSMFFINWTAGSVLTGYALHLGATPAELGLIGAVPLLAQAASPLVAWLAGRAGRRRGVAVAAAVLGRLLWLLAAALPALAPPEARVGWLVALVALSSVFIAGNATLWTAWMGDVVPPRERGRYFGLRTGVLGVVGTAANLAAGAWLDRVASPLDFQVVLLVAVGSGLVAAALLARHAEPPVSAARLHFRETFTAPLSDPAFRRFLLFAVYWQFAVLVAAPFVLPYFLGPLKMSFTQVAVWSAIASVAGLVIAPLWGRLADRVGNKPVLAIATVGAGTLLPLCWMLAGPGRLWPIWVSAVVDALVWGAIGPALFNLALASAPRANRAAFIAALSAASGLAGFAGGLLSGPLFTLFQGLELRLGGLQWTAYHWLFLASGLLRAGAWRFLRPVFEDRAWRTRDLLRSAVRRATP